MAPPHHVPLAGLTAGALLQGRYRLVRELVTGPSSAVYLGQDVEAGVSVTVRLFVPPVDTRERLNREAPAIRDLEHEHIARLLDHFETGERYVLVMEHVDGPDLATRVRTEGPLTSDEVAAVGRGVALALRAAHRRGLLHRGVSPRNILLAAETRARLIDFGAAEVEGDRDYRAPEVIAGQGADPRADLYGLGLALYFGVTGELPPRPARELPPAASPDGHRPSRLRSSIPPWLDEAIAQATAALPADRFISAGRLAEALTPARAVHRTEVSR